MRLDELKRSIRLRVFNSREIYDYLKKLFEDEEKITLEFNPNPEPRLSLPGVKIDNSEIYFHAIPKQNELESFIKAIKIVAEGVKGGSGIRIITFVAPVCPNCRATVDSINTLARKYAIEHHVVDATMFHDFAERHGVMSVPTTFIGKMRFVGALTPSKAEKWIRDAMNRDYRDYIIEKLASGEIEDVKAIVVEEKLGELLGELMGHEEFIVRLGAMATAEALEGEKEVVEGVKKAVRKLLTHEDARIREDAAMMLGMLGGEEDVKELENLISEGGRVADSAREAVEEIRRRDNG
ncbi:thioredoxin family protein [Archaeoglobus fulgidus]|jgi:thiol-disulfide isomerase/thioredoxin|uniref:NADH oxidase, putative n=3 Tax=Archaeoglobus fulgidus TaxID=2234 RepID=O29735_ARCFU|nr:thioredoxin family protein [Archaeoglobus fulgidus]AAB90716.1 NADH oxidase, putative [Archaeoglobus fulgidus DSM 4304]AIG97333.1 Alkyl hydroperoxide reductase, large subunit [Archaeoglobus fulgidus DSM 8774]KUJ93593.1 MAG: NADH oxidase, putative [Archaeoglobus fulgidus]KUK07146.1 MAG: NADH oxidase, putative [Archaeoglobus fulgidus]